MLWFVVVGVVIVAIVVLTRRRKPLEKKSFAGNKALFDWACTISAHPKSKLTPQFDTVIPALVEEITPRGCT
jgi:hypothetical protein